MSGDIPVKVGVRVRPFSERENTEGAQSCVLCYEEQNQVAINGKMFAFDHVFDVNSTQDSVYEACAAPMLECLFKGYNCTLLAYGQTGSGKTYTMGTEETSESVVSEQRGIIARIVDAIFKQIGESTNYCVNVSMLEIYEERVVDLLTPTRDGLQIRENKGAVFVQGLSNERVCSLATTMEQLEKGCTLRSKGVTAMNNKSSRSHAIFTITIEKLIADNDEDTCFKSKLHLVDLAGSERLKKTQAEGERMREGIKINEGLLALGNVIAALAEPSASGQRHIPYRDSKITRLLQDSLGGNSYTVMIACISPADTNAEETISTLRYADRTKKIKNKPIVNVDPAFALVESLRTELAAAKRQIASLMNGEQPGIGGCAVDGGSVNFASSELMAERERLAKELDDAHDEVRRLNFCLAEEVAEKSHILEQLLSARQAFESLKQRIRTAFEGKLDEYELLNALEGSFSHGVIDENNTEDTLQEKTDEDDGDDNSMDHSYLTHFAEKQSALSRQFASLLDEIKNKEQSYEATEQSKAQLEKMRAKHTAELEELQTKLVAIEKERDELRMKLKGTSIRQNLCEERRKRLNELEKQIASNKERIRALQRIEKENSNLQEHAKKLSQELLELKRLRVKMARQMKEEEAKFRKWKTKADREMMQMKSRERKREFETARAQRMSAQQLAVYRRKYEEAIACNRRLQQQLVKSSSSKRNEKKMSSELINYLDNELRMAIWTAEARWHCDVLIEQRKTLSEQLKKKKEHLNRLNKEPPKKKHVSIDRTSSDNNSELRQLEREIAGLQQEISSYNIEIHDAQADCMKADEREDQRWLGIDSTVNIKSVLKHLFEAAVNQRKMALEKEQEMDDAKRLLQEENKVKEEQIKELKSNLKHEQNTIKTIQERLTRRELDFDETTMNIINMYDADENTVNVDVLKRLERVMNSMNRISELQESVTAKEEQIKSLKEQLINNEKAKAARRRKREATTNQHHTEEHVDEDDSDMDISVSFNDDSSDVTYVPPGPSRRTSKRPTKRSIEELGTDGMNATFVIDSNVPGESKANICPERDNDGANHKENIELVLQESVTSSSKNAPRKSTEDCGIPQTVLTTNPAKLKARKKRRPGKALSKEPDDLAKTVHEIFAKLT